LIGQFQEKNLIDVTGRIANGGLLVQMNLQGTIGSTQVQNLSSAKCVKGRLHAQTIWHYI